MTFRCWKCRSWDIFSRVSSLCFLWVLVRYRSECMTLNEQHDFSMSGFLYVPQNLTCKILCCNQCFPHCQNWKMSIHFPFFDPPRGRECLFLTMSPKNLGWESCQWGEETPDKLVAGSCWLQSIPWEWGYLECAGMSLCSESGIWSQLPDRQTSPSLFRGNFMQVTVWFHKIS